jgi:NADH dehydrogenase
MGVEIRLHTRVSDVNEHGVLLGEEQLHAGNVFWAAGVQGQQFASSLGVETDRAGRVLVGPDLSIPGHPEVFVVGDAAHAVDTSTGNMVPGVAQGAIQTGRFAADIIAGELQGAAPADRPEFRYRDKGSMAMIGRGNAIAALGKRHFGGFLGWLFWGLVHVMFLIGFGNRLLVMSEWFWNYVRRTRRSRLITEPSVPPRPNSESA